MKKKYLFFLPFILIFFTSACTGYKPIFNSSSLMIEIKDHKINGNKKLGERMYQKLSNLLKSKNKEGKKNIDLFIDISTNKESSAKDKSGKILEYRITLNTYIKVKNYDTENLIFDKNFSNSLSYKTQSEYSQSISSEDKIVDDLIEQTYQEFLITLIQNIN